jgi:hypothetical protein
LFQKDSGKQWQPYTPAFQILSGFYSAYWYGTFGVVITIFHYKRIISMTYRQSQRLKEFQQLKAAFDQYATTWSANVRLSADVSLFLLNLTSIEAQAVIQEVNSAGIGQTKETIRTELTDQAILAATAVQTFAYHTKNQLLAAKVDYKKSYLTKIKEADLVSACQVILVQATEHVSCLGDYGVDAVSLTDLQTAINDFRKLTPQPQTAALSGKAVTKGLSTLFRQTSQLVRKSMDGMLLQYKKKAPNFYTAYSSARAVGREVYKRKKTAVSEQPVAAESVL